jgi:hypothetical protein
VLKIDLAKAFDRLEWTFISNALHRLGFNDSVRHGYHWVPTVRITVVPGKWVRPIRRLADLTVGPTDVICGLEDLQKILFDTLETWSTRHDIGCAAR